MTRLLRDKQRYHTVKVAWETVPRLQCLTATRAIEAIPTRRIRTRFPYEQEFSIPAYPDLLDTQASSQMAAHRPADPNAEHEPVPR